MCMEFFSLPFGISEMPSTPLPWWPRLFSLSEGLGYRLHAPGFLQCPSRAAVPSLRCPGAVSADSVWWRGGKERRCGEGHCGRLGCVRAAAEPHPRCCHDEPRLWFLSVLHAWSLQRLLRRCRLELRECSAASFPAHVSLAFPGDASVTSLLVLLEVAAISVQWLLKASPRSIPPTAHSCWVGSCDSWLQSCQELEPNFCIAPCCRSIDF